MKSSKFPSGDWYGYFVYAGERLCNPMELYLNFDNGSMMGTGGDGIGEFTCRGEYSEDLGKCSWIKTYPGSHSVNYFGVRKGRGISGQWETTGACNDGGFFIWPVGQGGDATSNKAANEKTSKNESLLVDYKNEKESCYESIKC